MPKYIIMFFGICPIILNAQLKLALTFVDKNNKPVNNVNIQVKKYSSALLGFFNTEEMGNNIVIDLETNKDDTLIFEYYAVGYFDRNDTLLNAFGIINATIKFLPINDTINNSFNINDTLNDIVVKAQKSIWIRGDTTFFNVAAFKNGDEKKLEDLLKTLPYFNVKTDGTITYKNKEIKKIRIDGEGLLESEIKTLIKNIPSAVIENIQAIENYNGNVITKGLIEGHETILNIGLKKKFKGKVFGDVDLSSGNNNRYQVNPTIVSLLKQLKFVSINNLAKNDLLPDDKGFALKQVRPNVLIYNCAAVNSSLERIDGVGADRFMLNKYQATKNQINVNFSKEFKSQIFLNYLNNKFSQITQNESIFLSNTNRLNRLNIRNVSQNNRYFNIGTAFQIEKPKVSFTGSFFYNTDDISDFEQKSQVDNLSSVNAFNKLNIVLRNSFVLNSEATVKFKETLIVKIIADYFNGKSKQDISNQSDSLSKLFNQLLTNNIIVNSFSPTESTFNFNGTFFKLNNKKPETLMFTFKASTFYLNNAFLNNNTALSNFLFLNYSNVVKYELGKINKRKEFVIGKLDLKANMEVGFLRHLIEAKNKLLPIYNFSLFNKWFKNKNNYGAGGGLTLGILNSINEVQFTRRFYMPTQLSFRQMVNPNVFNSQLNGKIEFYQKSLNISFFAGLNNSLVSTEIKNTANYLFIKDSAIFKDNYEASFNISNTFYNKSKRNSFMVDLVSDFSKSYYNNEPVSLLFNYLSISTQLNYKRRYFLNLNSEIQYVNTFNSKTSGIPSSLINFTGIASLKTKIKDKYFVSFKQYVLSNQSIDRSFRHFLLSDFKLNVQANAKWNFSLLINNLFNVLNYNETNKDVLFIQSKTIRLIPRTFMLQTSFNF